MIKIDLKTLIVLFGSLWLASCGSVATNPKDPDDSDDDEAKNEVGKDNIIAVLGLTAFDLDVDGTLDNQDELDELGLLSQEIIEIHDQDNDGYLTCEAGLCLAEGEFADAGSYMAERRTGKFAALVTDYDSDGDGALDETEKNEARIGEMALMARFRKLLNAEYDLDASGDVSQEEQLNAMLELKQMRHEEQADRIAIHDEDGDGRLTVTEIRQAMQEGLRVRAREMSDLMDRFDSNHDGQLTGQEEEGAVAARKLARQEKRQAREDYDLDGDGELSQEERRKAIQNEQNQESGGGPGN